MVFSSYIFLLFFLPFSLGGYFLLSRFAGRLASRIFLVIICGVFYGWFNPAYLWILIGSIAFNYILGGGIGRCRGWHKTVLYWLGIAGNILLLGYYKYYDFFLSTVNSLFETDYLLRNLLLPLGISFFTFQQISYLYEIYTGRLKHYNLIDYTLFVSFFPQLIAGPIVLPDEMMSQFAKEDSHRFSLKNFAPGLWLFSIGLAKKVLLADEFAIWADDGFNAQLLSSPAAWQSVLAYTLQIYFDFSGYCDMAAGIGLMYNVRLPVNFDLPYRSADIQEFWRRWHITLGRFLAAFVYIPLGGSRTGKARTLLNLFITFFVSGIWHGAGWLFILWGMLHGTAIVIHRIWHNFLNWKMPVWCGRVLTFLFVMLAWVLFRAESMEQAGKVYHALFTPEWDAFKDYFREVSSTRRTLLIAALFAAFCLRVPAIRKIDDFKPNLWNAVFTFFLLIGSVFMLTRESPFIYFNF